MPKISKNQVKYVRSLQQKKVRDAEGVFVAEGEKCITEMLKSFQPVMLISSQPVMPISSQPNSLSWLEASTTEIEQMSSLRTPQGAIGVFRRPSYPLPSPNYNTPPKKGGLEDLQGGLGGLLLSLDGVQDPGNLGTIIRTADWFGIRDIVCSLDTADCWNPKVVQATMGALARVRVHYTNLVEWIGEMRGCAASRAATLSNDSLPNDSLPKQGGPGRVFPIYGTLLDGRNIYTPNAIPQKQNGIIVMGNEGNGISPEVKSLITHPLFIPSYPEGAETSESLNVAIATAVILAEFRRP